MATNPWITKNNRNEQGLYEDLVIESLQFYGEDVYYLPRELVNKDVIFGDDVPSRFTDAYKIEMYIENNEGFGGEGDLFTKFGIELRDQATFVVARKRWKGLIGNKLDAYNFRPREGDIIYLPMSESMFEIFKVETETPFYQLQQLPTFRLQCELFEYNDEDFDTGIDFINQIEAEGAYQYKIPLLSTDSARPTFETEINTFGEVTSIDVQQRGAGFYEAPTVTVSPVDSDNAKFGITSLNVGLGRGVEQNYLFESIEGFAEFWIYPQEHPLSGQDAILLTGDLMLGVTVDGYLCYSRDQMTDPRVLTSGTINRNQWNHVLIGAEQDPSDTIVRNLYIYVNGQNVLDDLANTDGPFDIISADGFSIGAQAARTTSGGVSYGAFNGWIDDFRVAAQRRDGVFLNERVDGAQLLVPGGSFDSDTDVAYFNKFNGRQATATAGVAEGGISAITITDPGEGYLNPPTITVSNLSGGGYYTIGEIVTQQTGDGSFTKGEVVAWNDSDNILYLAHVGANDGHYHDISLQYAIHGENADYVPALVEELQLIQQSSQNDVFDDFESDFLDFSESNPFGDAS